jgi:UDP-N-acetylmuramoyl-tripeptide--D-alanyl-D-alanine ligase
LAEGTLAEAMRVMQGQLLAGDSRTEWSGAAIDSRRVRSRELFFALPGEQTDGHRFVGDALARGAAAAVVHESVERPEQGGLIRVDDALSALHSLTRHVRQRLPRSLVGVTGSAGKTTTKELLARMLKRRFRAAGSPGNLNNLYGFPLALLSMPEGTEWMVAEMGMSTPGELSQVSRLGRPDAVVLTNVRAAHLEFFGSVREIGDAKGEILDGLESNGLVVANADDPEVMRIAARHSGRIVTFALESEADHRACEIEVLGQGGTQFTWRADGDDVKVRLPLLGTYNVENFLAAAACASELGVSREAIAEAAEGATPEQWRGQIHHSRGATIVDDSYNSNPAALEKALKSARELPGRRHWAVLGAMLELGKSSTEYHQQLGARAVEEGFSVILGVGEEARALVESVRRSGGESEWFASADEVAPAAAARLEPGDVILVKGSRGIGLETVVEYLLAAEAGN